MGFFINFKSKVPRLSSTGSPASALTARAILSPGLAQGSGSLQANEAISYHSVPLQYAKSMIPNKANVGKPISQHTNFVAPTQQRAQGVKNPGLSARAGSLNVNSNFKGRQ